jgi:predicted short-subunit dehydrogenase-like oxidoreductase (DUF2520 family)
MLAIIGGGRMGRGLALALADAGEQCHLWSRREAGGAVSDAVSGAATVILAVPDDAIAPVAGELALARAISADQVVLHLSGVHGRSALAALDAVGAALGSLHPLQTVSDPATAARRWRGAYAAVEGDERAANAASRIAELLGMFPFPIASASKIKYHAGAAMAGNYSVVLAGMAARLAREAGVPEGLANRIYLPLLAGAVENLGTSGAVSALTGPIKRGDAATVQLHLSTLADDERRLYVALGLEALQLARAAGLDPQLAMNVEAILRRPTGR